MGRERGRAPSGSAFQLRPRCVCSTALGTPVEPEVNRTSATSEARPGQVPAPTGGPPTAPTKAAGSEKVSGVSSSTSAGSICPRAASTSAAPKEWRTGAATAPMRQQARGRTAAARLLGTCQATTSPLATPRTLRPPAIAATSCLRLDGGEAGVTVDDLAPVGGDQRVERRHVPRPAGSAIAASQVRHPGRSQVGRHGRAPYPGPTNVTPMSGSSTGPVWTSR